MKGCLSHSGRRYSEANLNRSAISPAALEPKGTFWGCPVGGLNSNWKASSSDWTWTMTKSTMAKEVVLSRSLSEVLDDRVDDLYKGTK
jgi:hypothetical protein